MEIDAPASGVLRNVTGKEGVDIPVGAPVAWIYADDEAYGADAAPAKQDEAPISPPVGEMPAKPTEGALSRLRSILSRPPLPAGHLPTRGEIGESSGGIRATPWPVVWPVRRASLFPIYRALARMAGW